MQEFSDTGVPYSMYEAMELIRRALTQGPQIFEWRSRRYHGDLFWSEVALRACEIAGQKRVIASIRDITERKQFEQERLEHLRFVESLDQINRAMQGTNNLELMMSDALDTMLAIFDCDRAFLVYPCDPRRSRVACRDGTHQARIPRR